MQSPEIRYIGIQRSNDGSLSVNAISDPINVFGTGAVYSAKLETYPKVESGMVVAIRFIDGSKPFPIESARDRWLSVMSENGIWWIFAHWNSQKQCFVSELYNSIGRVEVKTPTLSITLEIESPDLSLEDLKFAIDDFKLSLLGLVAEKSSVFAETTLTSASVLLTDGSYRSIRAFVQALVKMNGHFKTRLTHRNGEVPLGRARLTGKGECQYLLAPDRRLFHAHTTGESMDTGENRFLLETAKRLMTFLKSLDRAREIFHLGLVEQANTTVPHEFVQGAKKDFLTEYLSDQGRLDNQKKGLGELWKKIEAQGLEDLEKALNTTIVCLKAGGVKDGFTMANPMVFHQNPLYRDFYRCYRRLSRVFETIRSLHDIDKAIGRISLTNLPNFYERWCLVKLFQVLTESFHFEPSDPEWKHRLLTGVTANSTDMVFEFKTPSVHRFILTYQRKIQALHDGHVRYPDFTLTFGSQRWVFDSKLRLHASHQELMELCDELADIKGYSMGGTLPVFILHCAPYGGIETEKNRANVWRRSSHYGADGHNFKKGHVFVSFERKYRQSSYDNLKRLVLLILQEEDLPICPHCGQMMLANGRVGVGTKYECPNCQKYIVQTHCFHCHRRIWKNGWYWAYSEFEGNSSNIRCPSCRENFTNSTYSHKQIEQENENIDDFFASISQDWPF